MKINTTSVMYLYIQANLDYKYIRKFAYYKCLAVPNILNKQNYRLYNQFIPTDKSILMYAQDTGEIGGQVD